MGSALPAPLQDAFQLDIPRTQQAPARKAIVEIRYRKITLHPPTKRASEKLPKVPIWAILVTETEHSSEAEAVEWLLLSTVPVLTLTDAYEQLDWYCARWGIEVWHKVLKSGTRLEALQLGTAERLQRAIPLFSVVAWRLMFATFLSRQLPHAPCTILLEPSNGKLFTARFIVSILRLTLPLLYNKPFVGLPN